MNSSDDVLKYSTTDKIEGNAKIISGTIKEETGKALHSPNLKAKGNAEKNVGHVQKKIGEIEKVLDV